MKRYRGLLWILTFMPALTMLGSLILMNDGDDTSRRGMLSILLLLLGVGQMVVFPFFIGFFPAYDGLALRMGALSFLSFTLIFVLRMAERYAAWIAVMATDETARIRIILSVAGGLVSVGLFLLGFLIARHRRKNRTEVSYENDAIR